MFSTWLAVLRLRRMCPCDCCSIARATTLQIGIARCLINSHKVRTRQASATHLRQHCILTLGDEVAWTDQVVRAKEQAFLVFFDVYALQGIGRTLGYGRCLA